MLRPDLITQLQDMRDLEWSRSRQSSGTAGSYLKSYGVLGGQRIYYKLSCYDPIDGITGHECVNELIISRLLDILGIEHVQYQLIHALVLVQGREYETWLCASEDFKAPEDSKTALDDYYDLLHRPDESPLEFCRRMGWEKQISRMFLTDYLILNRDRHGANMEVLKNRKDNTIRLAPLFDHGLSLLYSCHDVDAVERFDVMKDLPVQSWLGSRSARSNLELITINPEIAPLRQSDKYYIMGGIDEVLPGALGSKIWQMLIQRWSIYEDICHKR